MNALESANIIRRAIITVEFRRLQPGRAGGSDSATGVPISKEQVWDERFAGFEVAGGDS
jgi:hypothetical protein